MKTSLDIWKWLMPVWLLCVSCIHEDLVYDCGVEDLASYPYVVLRIAVPSEGTRSNPMGGEEGNGREEGILNEEVVNNINVFFYNDPQGLDGEASTIFLHHIYYNLNDRKDPENTDITVEWKDESEANKLNYALRYLELAFKRENETLDLQDGVKFAVVVNTGKITPANLGELRDLTLEQAASSLDAHTAADFVMSTAYNDIISVGGVTTTGNTLKKSGNGFVGIAVIERMVGRIDLWYDAVSNAGIASDAEADTEFTNLKYNVEGSDNLVYITNVLPVNVMQTPSYMFKKVTNVGTQASYYWTASNLKSVTSFSWGGKETPNEGFAGADMPSNYVMERTTALKSSGGSATHSVDWFCETCSATVMTSITNTENGRISEYYHEVRSKDPDYNCDRISIISYANENTHPIDCFHSDYLTGLAFRGFYLPSEIYSAYDAVKDALTVLEDKNSLPQGGQIYRYSPSGGKDDSDTDDPHKSKEPSEKYAKYFSNENAANAYKNAHPTENGILTAFTAVVDEVLGLGFACYYNLWLRHFNDVSADPWGIYPMEYATVRNNIYRVAISFTGPGDRNPTMREPDTMQARIFVRKWNLRKEDNPLEF